MPYMIARKICLPGIRARVIRPVEIGVGHHSSGYRGYNSSLTLHICILHLVVGTKEPHHA